MDYNEQNESKTIEALEKVVRLAVETVHSMGSTEEELLDAITEQVRPKLFSTDAAVLSGVLLGCLKMSVAWNDAVESLGDASRFHRDALAKRLLKVLWEE